MQTILNISDESLCRLTIVDDNGLSVNKTVSYTQVLSLLNACSNGNTIVIEEEVEETEIYPCDNIVSTLQVKTISKSNSKWYILLRHNVPVDFEYFGDVYKNIGVPKTIFAIKVSNGRVIRFKIVCVKDIFITEDTKIYAYPFSNVSTDGTVCTGANRDILNLPVDEKNIYNLISIPEMFFAMPNTEHSYGHNLSGLYYRDLLKELSNTPFKNEWLKPTGMTYSSFIKTLND